MMPSTPLISGNRGAEDAALHKPLPFTGLVNGIRELKLVLAVESLGHLGGQRSENPIAVGGEVSTVRGIDADQ